MSRTFKDERKVKNKNRFRKEPGLRSRYAEMKVHGFHEDFENSLCPDCGGLCEYQDGFYTCSECHWGGFANERDFETTDELEFSRAS